MDDENPSDDIQNIIKLLLQHDDDIAELYGRAAVIGESVAEVREFAGVSADMELSQQSVADIVAEAIAARAILLSILLLLPVDLPAKTLDKVDGLDFANALSIPDELEDRFGEAVDNVMAWTRAAFQIR